MKATALFDSAIEKDLSYRANPQRVVFRTFPYLTKEIPLSLESSQKIFDGLHRRISPKIYSPQYA
jgi:hypothetical protein